MQEPEDSEEGEAPADPSAGEWLPVTEAFQRSGGLAWGLTTHTRPWRAVLAG